MMPDLGKYADAVLGSYAVSIALIVIVAGWSLWRGAKVRRALAVVEARGVKARAVEARRGAKKHG